MFGEHVPGRTDIWRHYEKVRDSIGLDFLGGGTGGIGTPAALRSHLRSFADAGVDQTVFIQQGGNNRHEHICEALQLFHDEVQSEFKAEEADRQRRKQEELAPYIEAAFTRKQYLAELGDDEIPTFPAYGFEIAEANLSHLPKDQQDRVRQWQKLREVVREADKVALAD